MVALVVSSWLPLIAATETYWLIKVANGCGIVTYWAVPLKLSAAPNKHSSRYFFIGYVKRLCGGAQQMYILF